MAATCVAVAGLRDPPMRARWHTIVFFGRIGIPYKCPAFAARDSLDAKPVTGSLHFATSRCRLADFIAEGLVLCVLCEFLLAIVCRVFRILLWHCSDTEMATDDRSGVNFDVELQVPWNALEAYVNLDSDGVYELQTVPDVLGLHSRQPRAAVVRVLLGRDDHSVCALVPDQRVIDRGFHEVTLVDMGDTAGPHVSVADLSVLWLQVLQWRGFGTLQCGQYPLQNGQFVLPEKHPAAGFG